MSASSPIPSSSSVRPAISDEIVVQVTGLTKVFKDFWGRPKARAVDNVDFEIRRGEIFGLLGPNGSGKSTTIKMLLGLLYPTRGHIEVFGHSPRDVATKARIGFLPEESYLYRYLNPGETLDFFGSLFELDSRERRQRTEQLIEMVGLNQARSRTVGEFSKGMQRRIGIAQALINDPDLIILDEPTSGLDPIGCREVKDLILALAQRGKTVILSSHLLADVEDVCDRVVIYYGGRIHAQGTLNELLSAQDRIQITAPVLSREVTERVLTILREEVGDQVRLENPTQNLERYFLNVVERARGLENETSGATSGNQVAEFIRGGGAAATSRSDSVLQRLTKNPSASNQAAGAAAEGAITANEERARKEAENQAKLEKLTAAAKPKADPSVASPASIGEEGAQDEGSKPADLKKANEKLQKLSGLLGQKPTRSTQESDRES